MLNSTYNFHQQDDLIDSTVQIGDLKLPYVSGDHANLLNSWYGNTSPITFPFHNSMLSLTPFYSESQLSETQLKYFTVLCNQRKLVIGIEPECISFILKNTANDLSIDALSAHDLALVSEFALLPIIEPFEKNNNLSFQVTPYTTLSHDPFYALLMAKAQLQNESHSYICTFHCLEEDLGYWTSIFQQRNNDAPLSYMDNHICLPLILRYCQQEFTLGTFRNLNPSDVIILHSERSNKVEICVGSYLFWFANNIDDGFKIISEARLQNNFIHNNTKNNWTNIMSGSEDIASIDDIPVTASFEIGRKDVTVKELREFKDGTIISFPGTEDNQIKITVNGKEIGWGTLVQVDDCIGVKIDRVFVNG